MSYSIFYQIKASETESGKFKLTYETGDSNVYEKTYGNRWKRARYWGDEKMITGGEEVTSKELEDKLNQFVKSCFDERYDPNEGVSFEQYKKGFGWYESLAVTGKHTTKTKWGDIKNMYLRSIKKVM